MYRSIHPTFCSRSGMQTSEMSKLQLDIDELSERVKRLERTTNPTDMQMQMMLAMRQELAAMRQELAARRQEVAAGRQELAAMRQKEVLLMQSEAARKRFWVHGSDLAVNPSRLILCLPHRRDG